MHAASHIVRARPYQEALEAERGLDDKDKIGPASAAHFIHVGKPDCIPALFPALESSAVQLIQIF